MTIKSHLILSTIFTIFLFSSCSKDDSDNNPSIPEPKLTEDYYFEGKLDNEPFLIEKKYYDDIPDDTPFRIGHGGTLINCAGQDENGIYIDCYTIYSCGIGADVYSYPEEEGKYDTGGITFGNINVDKRVFEDELAALKDFLQKDELTFRRDFGANKKSGSFSFDFYPPYADQNDQTYYSTRFNDNTEYTANITSVEELDDYFYVIEGTVDSCKMYAGSQGIDNYDSYKILTDFKFRVKIKGSFNYDNYKD